MGLVIFAVFGLYLIIAVVVVVIAARTAKGRGKSPWAWGTAAALVMYLLVFWDHIPTMLVHKYYCEKEGGFWISKTMDQWERENPGAVETLTPAKGAPSTREGHGENYTRTYRLNQRFLWRVKKNGPYLLHRWRHEQEVVDSETSEALTRYVDFSTGYGELGVHRGEDWRILKFWLARAHCAEGAVNQAKIEQFMLQAKNPARRDKK